MRSSVAELRRRNKIQAGLRRRLPEPGATLLQTGRHAEAMADFERVLQLKPDNEQVY